MPAGIETAVKFEGLKKSLTCVWKEDEGFEKLWIREPIERPMEAG